jgi:hypothetical protein
VKQVTELLHVYRQARLDVLNGRAARQQRLCTEAEAARSAAESSRREALDWLAQAENPHRAPPAQRDLMQAMRPSCEALVARRSAVHAAAERTRVAAAGELQAARRAVQAQERALLRGHELRRLLREMDVRHAEVAESLDDEDLACARAWRP